MKTYNFKIEVEDFNNGSTLMDSLINDVVDEKRQLELTYSINKESTKVHMQILKDFCAELDKEFNKIGLGSFGEFRNDIGRNTNKYCDSFARLIGGLNHCGVIISVEGCSISGDKFKDSKYTTITNGYTMYLYTNSCTCYVANQVHKSKYKITCVNDVINRLESGIKEYLHTQKDLV